MLVAALATSGWAALVSFAPVLVMVLLVWFSSGSASTAAAVRFAVTGWLLAHGVPVMAPHGPVGLVPLALTALIVWRLVRAGAHTARATGATPGEAGHAVVAVMAGYGSLGSIAALIVSSPQFEVSPLRAFLTTAALAGLASAPGALVETGAAALVWARLPDLARDGLRLGTIAAVVILSAGAALAGVATVLAYQDAVQLFDAYGAGVTDGAGVTLVCLLYLPDVAIWAATYLIGPGFSFGVGADVNLFQVSLGPLPAVPVLAGLPAGPAPAAGVGLLVIPVLAGMAAGVSMARRHPERGALPLTGGAVLVGLVAGAILCVASFAASGPLGSGRLAHVGPTAWLIGLVTAGVVGGGALAAAGLARALAIGPPVASRGRRR